MSSGISKVPAWSPLRQLRWHTDDATIEEEEDHVKGDDSCVLESVTVFVLAWLRRQTIFSFNTALSRLQRAGLALTVQYRMPT